MPTPHYLYELKFPNGKRYIGISSAPKKRWQLHKDHARRGSKLSVHRAIRKYGWGAVEKRVLVVGDRGYIGTMEAAAIQAFQTLNQLHGYNLVPGGAANPMDDPATREKMRRSLTGRKDTPEVCAKKKSSWTPERRAAEGARLAAWRRAHAKGRAPRQKKLGPHGNTGKIRSPETREKIAVTLRGRKASPERLEKIRAVARSPEVRAKMRTSAQRRWHAGEQE